MAVAARQLSLAQSARTANEHHHLAVDESARVWFEHAVIVGETLTAVRDSLGKGDWMPWVKGNLHFGIRMANGYMRIAEYKTVVNVQQGESFNDAIRKLRWLPMRTQHGRSISDETLTKTREMLAHGRSMRSIGKEVNHDPQSLRYHLDPDAGLRKRSANRQAQKRNYLKRKEAERVQQRKDMQKVGGDLKLAYNNVMRAVRYLERLDEKEWVGYSDIYNAINHLHNAEFRIIAVMKKGKKNG